jgi:parallel beta-helix repeat protein
MLASKIPIHRLTPVLITLVLLGSTIPLAVSAAMPKTGQWNGGEGSVLASSNDLTCTHDGSAWGSLLSCTLDSASLAPGESQALTLAGKVTNTLPVPMYVINPVTVTASDGGETFIASDRARTWVSDCAVRLNDTPMGIDLQAAINASTLPSDVVKVSGYCPVHDLNLNKTLVLQGGWSPDFDQWDPAVYTTTLDGQGLGRVMGIVGSINPIIEGFVFTGGSSDFGGGIFISSDSATIQNNTITGNSATAYGGGIFISSCSPTIQNNTFTRNNAPTGGGLSNDAGNPIIKNNTFTGNGTGYRGGGLYNGSGSPTIQNNTFTGNSGGNRGGGLFNDSGNPTIQNNTFTGNQSIFGGGLVNHHGSPAIENNTFTSNSGNYGGGLFNFFNNPSIQNNTFTDNSAINYGGGLVNDSGSPFIQNNAFSGNYAPGLLTSGGNPVIQNNTFSDNIIGGLGITDGSPIIQNNTFFNNRTPIGGALNISDGSPIILSNIIVNNSGYGIDILVDATPTLDYNDIWNNTGGDYAGIAPGVHDISADPLMVEPAYDNFHLAPGSPCIDAGDPVNFPETDFEGDLRPYGNAPDIGADEFNGTVVYIRRVYLPLLQK